MDKLTPKQQMIANNTMVQELIAIFQGEIIVSDQHRVNVQVSRRIDTWVDQFEVEKRSEDKKGEMEL